MHVKKAQAIKISRAFHYSVRHNRGFGMEKLKNYYKSLIFKFDAEAYTRDCQHGIMCFEVPHILAILAQQFP